MHAGAPAEEHMQVVEVPPLPPWPAFHFGTWLLSWLDRLRDALTPPHVRAAQLSVDFIRPQARPTCHWGFWGPLGTSGGVSHVPRDSAGRWVYSRAPVTMLARFMRGSWSCSSCTGIIRNGAAARAHMWGAPPGRRTSSAAIISGNAPRLLRVAESMRLRALDVSP